MGLRPAFDRYDSNEPVMDRHNRRYKRWAKSYDAFMDAVENPRLFLPAYLYQQLIAIQSLSHKEGIGFEIAVTHGSEPGKLGFNDFTAGQKNIEEMNQAIENALLAIRKRYDLED
jgi:hypothetical protein